MHGGARVAFYFVGPPDWYPFLKSMMKFLIPSYRQLWENGPDFGAIVSHLTAERLRRCDAGDNPDDFLACSIRDKSGQSRGLDPGEVEAETNILCMLLDPLSSSHRDPTLFPQPERFMPLRWLDGNSNLAKMRAVFMPFSPGGRACIGMNITIMEQQILVATIIHRYNFTLPSDDWQ
ncbi:hypothetical protein ASPACDRAFT_1859112 [Aspergillus aculeatus ATCC 16872]|uniref:Cytochrome P450 n=1 Tax=Aspergillus aculeatus (strain ATCC 16872 / CBS 172.66 / WB 5094) TaxID=690307 RepID=A0A1L9WJU0_ASPA1|nr:uncharacterized protein ASPACDRAFT_1859112 [Aspergillus aculeatus ATCC 16872]OJJ96422.1 hypothetical protein ASPACDRAFT_1859112 [Aspergillus aculeatus ATCC 16872]